MLVAKKSNAENDHITLMFTARKVRKKKTINDLKTNVKCKKAGNNDIKIIRHSP